MVSNKLHRKCHNFCKVCVEYYVIYSKTFYFSASQMWLLGRLLPLMIGHLIPFGDEHWSLYLLLLDIVDILFSPDINEDDISLLSVLIQDHHSQFRILYPSAAFLPKMHYMVHMPGFIYQ